MVTIGLNKITLCNFRSWMKACDHLLGSCWCLIECLKNRFQMNYWNILYQEIKEVLSIQVRKMLWSFSQHKNIFWAYKIEMTIKFKVQTLNSNTRILQEFYFHRQSFPTKISFQSIRNEPFLENALTRLLSCSVESGSILSPVSNWF